mgnify:CR=1 FL=1
MDEMQLPVDNVKFNTYICKSSVWKYPGMAGWHFIAVPGSQSAAIKKRFGTRARGWGSLPVEVAMGSTRWHTSIFPDKKSGGYLLPLKAEVRKRERIGAGDVVSYTVRIREP